MIYRPKQGSMWDTSVIYHKGRFYTVMMYAPEDGNIFRNSSKVFLATSEDGVHWQDVGIIVDECKFGQDTILFKPQLRWIGDRFFMDHGVLNSGSIQDMLRFFESTDLKNWTHLGNSIPDRRWYIGGKKCRWDHMYMLPKNEGDLSAGFWGYLVAVPSDEHAKSFGMMESDNGIDWHILPPPEIEWGDVPPITLEVGGCERIGDKYVVIGGEGKYLNEGYSMYTLIGNSPTGPFKVDRECFRLCGTTSKSVTWLACWCRGKDDEMLICNYAGENSNASMLPLRKALFDDGHLHLGWWKGNEALKGEAIWTTSKSIDLRSLRGRHVEWLDIEIDMDNGYVLEGEFIASPFANSGAVGFSFPARTGMATDVRLGIGAKGPLRQTTIGQYNDLFGYSPEDYTGQGCATVSGVEADRKNSFRMLVHKDLLQLDLFELYVNDLLVQTYTLPHRKRTRTFGECKRIGLLAVDANVAFSELRLYRMDL